jgi:hypothetical protein
MHLIRRRYKPVSFRRLKALLEATKKSSGKTAETSAWRYLSMDSSMMA